MSKICVVVQWEFELLCAVRSTHVLDDTGEGEDQAGRLSDEPDRAQVERKGHACVSEEGGDADEVDRVVERLEALDREQDDGVDGKAHRCGVVQTPMFRRVT